MKAVPVEDAVGMVLCQDLTKIVPGEFKGVAFKKGHIITTEDIPKMLDIGKKNIYVWEMTEGILHENEAGERMAKASAGKGILFSEPSEGKVNLVSEYKGLLKINAPVLEKLNAMDEAVVATLHTDIVVEQGCNVAGTRIIPLFIEQYKIEQFENICAKEGPVIYIEPLKSMKVGIITTGSEVYSGRITDKFGPVIKNKIAELDCEFIKQIFVTDDTCMIVDAVNNLISTGVELIIITGGMSVDPDDVTPTGIRQSGADIISYGAPVLPGSMFLVAYKEEIPILGLPGCVMYNSRTIFDLILPRILAGEKISRQDISKLGHGGLCLKCEVCKFPACSFGK
jgi:molybdenum cofactor synthesis domain-containing protein